MKTRNQKKKSTAVALPAATSADLLEAATNPAAALAEKPDDTPPWDEEAPPVGEVIEAEYSEVPTTTVDDIEIISDTELAAGELIKQELAKDDPPTEEEPPKKKFDLQAWLARAEEPPIERDEIDIWIVEFNLATKEKLVAFGEAIDKAAAQLKARTVAFGNELEVLWVNLQNKEWRAKTQRRFRLWTGDKTRAVVKWFNEFRSSLRSNAVTHAQMELMFETFHERLDEMDAKTEKLTKKIEGYADPKQLALFVEAILQGRKTNATTLYRTLTSTSLAEAKAAIEAMTAKEAVAA